MTIEELVEKGIQYGIPFPDIYDWTWGEIVNYINNKKEMRRLENQENAMMLFRTASLIAKFQSGTRGQKIKVIDEFDWLYTEEEKKQAKIYEVLKSFKKIDDKER